MKVTIRFTSLLILALVLSTNVVDAQCRNFTKRKCMKDLGEYFSNGQYNGAVMFQGEEASLMQTFYSEQQYRIAVCTHEVIAEGMFFEVYDYQKNLLYTSKETGLEVFDFNVESTQQLNIRIVIPDDPNSSNQIKRNGCVSVLVGFLNNIDK